MAHTLGRAVLCACAVRRCHYPKARVAGLVNPQITAPAQTLNQKEHRWEISRWPKPSGGQCYVPVQCAGVTTLKRGSRVGYSGSAHLVAAIFMNVFLVEQRQAHCSHVLRSQLVGDGVGLPVGNGGIGGAHLLPEDVVGKLPWWASLVREGKRFLSRREPVSGGGTWAGSTCPQNCPASVWTTPVSGRAAALHQANRARKAHVSFA